MISSYILGQKAEHRLFLTAIYQELRAQLPDAQEKISYGMPTFWQGANIIHFAAQKKHLGLYPGPEVIQTFAERLDELGYSYSKGAIQFPYQEPLPLDVIGEIAKEALKINGK